MPRRPSKTGTNVHRPDDFKAKVVAKIATGKGRNRQLSRSLDIPSQSISNWTKEAFDELGQIKANEKTAFIARIVNKIDEMLAHITPEKMSEAELGELSSSMNHLMGTVSKIQGKAETEVNIHQQTMNLTLEGIESDVRLYLQEHYQKTDEEINQFLGRER